MIDISAIMAFLQGILILLVGVGVKKVWDNSIILASIDKELKNVCKIVEDHEDRLRTLEAA